MKILRVFLVVVVALILFFMACATKSPPDVFQTCCKECLDAFSQSPVGVGPAGAICGRFSTAYTYSEGCDAYFTQAQIAVAMCK